MPTSASFPRIPALHSRSRCGRSMLNTQMPAATLYRIIVHGERYRDSFRAKHSVVVEYFSRPGLATQNPAWFGDRALLITDAAPGATGLPVLFHVLDDVHPQRSGIVICVDVSLSFRSAVGDAMETYAGNSPRPLTSRLLVCFAGNASTQTGMANFVSQEALAFELRSIRLRNDANGETLLER